MAAHAPAARSRYDRLRLHGALRGAIIAYGIGAYALFVPAAAGLSILAGIGLQLLVLAVRKLMAGRSSPAAMLVFELVVDGITVLLFALATFGGIAAHVGSL